MRAILIIIIVLASFVACENKKNPLLGVWKNDQVFEVVHANYASASLLYGDSIVEDKWQFGSQNLFDKLESIEFETDKWHLSNKGYSSSTSYTLIADSVFHSHIADVEYVFTFRVNDDTLYLKGVNKYSKETSFYMYSSNSDGTVVDSLVVTGEMIQKRLIRQSNN